MGAAPRVLRSSQAPPPPALACPAPQALALPPPATARLPRAWLTGLPDLWAGNTPPLGTLMKASLVCFQSLLKYQPLAGQGGQPNLNGSSAHHYCFIFLQSTSHHLTDSIFYECILALSPLRAENSASLTAVNPEPSGPARGRCSVNVVPGPGCPGGRLWPRGPTLHPSSSISSSH